MAKIEVSGILHHKSDVQTGMGKNGEWKRIDFVISENGTFFVNFTAFGEMADIVISMGVGSRVVVEGIVNSKEYNGRWFTNVNAKSVEMASTDYAQKQATAPQQPAQQGAQKAGFDDMPF